MTKIIIQNSDWEETNELELNGHEAAGEEKEEAEERPRGGQTFAQSALPAGVCAMQKETGDAYPS